MGLGIDLGLPLASDRVHVLVQLVNDNVELLRGLLLQVADGDARCEDGIVGVLGGQVGSRLSSQIVQLNCGDSRVDAKDDL